MRSDVASQRLPRVAVAVWDEPIACGVMDYLKHSNNGTFHVQIIDCHAMGRLDRWRGDGLIAPIVRRSWIRRLVRKGLPVVNTADQLSRTPFPTVRCDDLAVGRMAAEHLLGLGLRHFAFVGSKACDCTRLRRQGFTQRLRQEAAGCDCLMLPKGSRPVSEPAGAEALLTEWLKVLPKPVGVMAVTDAYAKALAEVCHRLGVRIPEDVALLGVGNMELYCQTAIPPLSSVDTRPRQWGYEAAALMCRLLAGESVPPEGVLIQPRGVVQRESTDVVAVADPLVVRAVRAIRHSAHQPTNVKQLIRDMTVSRRTLERRFYQAMGRSLHD